MKAFFIVLPLLICLVWLAILTLDCALSRCGREQRVLAAYALVCTLLYGCHAWHFMGPHTAFGPVDVLYSFCTLACYVVYYLYIKSLTEKDGISWRDALWLLPAVLTSLLAAVLLLLGKDTSAVPLVTKILTPLEIIPVAWFGLRRLQRFDRRVEGFYSDPENHSTRPVRILMLVFLSLALLAFVANVIGRDYFSCSMRIAIPSLLRYLRRTHPPADGGKPALSAERIENHRCGRRRGQQSHLCVAMVQPRMRAVFFRLHQHLAHRRGEKPAAGRRSGALLKRNR